MKLDLKWNPRASHYWQLESPKGVILGTVSHKYRPAKDNFGWHAECYGHSGVDFFEDVDTAKAFVERRLGVEQ